MTISYNVYRGILSLIWTIALGVFQYQLIFTKEYFGDPIEFLGNWQWLMISFVIASMVVEIIKLLRNTIKLKRSTLIIPINKNIKKLNFKWMIVLLSILVIVLMIFVKILIIRVNLVLMIIMLAFYYYLPSYKCGVYETFIYFKSEFYDLDDLVKIYTYQNEVRMTFSKKKGSLHLTRKIELESEKDEHIEFVRIIKMRSKNF